MNPSTGIEERYCGCCYCGQGWSYQGVEPPDELVKEVCEHERVCPKNPYTARIRELEAEIERLKGRMKEAEDLIKGLHDGWKKARKAHLETCKNAQAEIDKLHTENICLQELIQEFYEWTKREYPTEQEVREIMNRYHNLLNK